MKHTTTHASNSYLVFQLNNESYALNVAFVINILEMYEITKLPKMPPYVAGVINLRGEVLSVIDSHVKFDMPPLEITKLTCILALEVEAHGQQTKIGFLVDAVKEVLEIEQNKIKDLPTISARYNSRFIDGVIENAEKFTMILNINNIFSADEIIQLQME